MVDSWVAVKTQPRRERWAQTNIERVGASTFLPMVSKRHALFPGYIFVSIIDGRWWFLKSTPGCLHPVMTGLTPSRVPPVIVNDLRDACDDDGLIKIDEPKEASCPFRRGELLHVNGSTIFGNKLARFIGLAPRDRARVLLQLLGREVDVELPLGDLCPTA